MGAGRPKQYLEVGGEFLLDRSLGALLGGGACEAVALSLADDDARWPQARHHGDPKVLVCRGGATRARSVMNALDALAPRAAAADWVVVHDAVRPLFDAAGLARLLRALEDEPAGGAPACPVSDALKIDDGDGYVAAERDRRGVARAQTPQVFRYGVLRESLAAALAAGREPEDEAAAVRAAGHRVRLVAGDPANIKVTRPDDLPLVEALAGGAPRPEPRMGQGFDAHAFGPGDAIVLGGVRIPFERGIVAHSDGDVLAHAVCDALLGAAALGDIGAHFPSDEAHRGVAGREMLRRTRRLLGPRLRVSNLDATVIAQRPRLAPHLAEMRARVAADLEMDAARVSIKATSTDGLGFIGREEGLAVAACAVLATCAA